MKLENVENRIKDIDKDLYLLLETKVSLLKNYFKLIESESLKFEAILDNLKSTPLPVSSSVKNSIPTEVPKIKAAKVTPKAKGGNKGVSGKENTIKHILLYFNSKNATGRVKDLNKFLTKKIKKAPCSTSIYSHMNYLIKKGTLTRVKAGEFRLSTHH